MGWAGKLALHYRPQWRDGVRHTTALDQHEGPLRVLQRLYPEGPAVCHHVLVHPPGGLVGGDTLHLRLNLDADTHAVITTPGATRYYRSSGEPALQDVRAQLAAGSRLEWLPLETLAYAGCQGRNQLRFELAPGAEMLGWDILALGLPTADQPFDRGTFAQSIQIPGLWLEEGRIDAADTVLLDGPVGFAGRRVLATLWFAAGQPLQAGRAEALLDAARAAFPDSGGHLQQQHKPFALDSLACGASAPQPALVVLRVLAWRVEPALRLLAAVRAHWRALAWGLEAHPPRVWRT